MASTANTTVRRVMACAAQIDSSSRARCRHNAKGEGCICCSDHEHNATMAPKPDVILLKARVNARWVEKFELAGVDWNERDDAALQKRHEGFAQADRRQPRAVRQHRADSGCPVFGKDGARNVSVQDIQVELRRAGYAVENVHLYVKPSDTNGMATLTVVLKHDPEEAALPLEHDSTMFAVWKLTEDTSWEAAHVWANGANEQGNIVHTVNLVHRLPDARPEGHLVFNDGLWDVGSPTNV